MIKIVGLIMKEPMESFSENSVEDFKRLQSMSDEEWSKTVQIEKQILFSTTSDNLFILPRPGEVVHHEGKDYFVYQIIWGTSESVSVELISAILLLKEIDFSNFNRKGSTKKKRVSSIINKGEKIKTNNEQKNDIIFDFKRTLKKTEIN